MEKALSLEIDDFSKKNNGIKSDNFSSGGCEWFVKVYPKGYRCSDHLSLFLHVVNPESLRRGWKRRAIYCFVLSNQSGQVLYRSPMANIVSQDPYFVVDFRPENQWVQTKYMYLLGLVETLSKSPQSLSATELSNAQRDLTALTEAGFKLDWLNSKLEEVSLEWKKASHSDGSSVQQLKEQVKNVELSLSDLIVELENVKIKSAAAAKIVSHLHAAAVTFALTVTDFFMDSSLILLIYSPMMCLRCVD
ncbi:hypothetical protein YC2023_121333 [Brassica napus]